MAKFTIKIPKSLISYCDFRDKSKRTTDGIAACDLLFGLMLRGVLWTVVISIFFAVTLAFGGMFSGFFHEEPLPPSWSMFFSALPYTTSFLVAWFAIAKLCKYVDFAPR